MQQWQRLPPQACSEMARATSRHTLSSVKARSIINQVSTNIYILYQTAPALALVGGKISGEESATATEGQGQHAGTLQPCLLLLQNPAEEARVHLAS